MGTYHHLLLRQLKRVGLGDPERPPDARQWHDFLARVDRAYVESDQSLYLHERSLAVSSREMQLLYAQLEEAHRLTGLGSWTYEAANDSMKWSAECLRALGVAADAPAPTYREVTDRMLAADCAAFRARIRDALHKGCDFQATVRLLGAEAPRWVEIHGHPVRDEAGRVLRLHGTLMDVTAQKAEEERMHSLNAELEHRVGERTRQLEVANRELEAFSYSVSHDLRAPLRAIAGFARLLGEEGVSARSRNARDLLGRIERATTRMAQIIEDLLDLARLSRAEVHLEPTDLTRMARAVIEELKIDSPERRVETRVDARLTADADPGLLRIALENLLANAWKYSRKREAPCVQVGGIRRDGEQAYFVRDNGVGFDMRYAGDLFAPFKRLHHESEFEGTGIGLATVQRIIARHGGRIWAESAPDQGATFYFTLCPPPG